MRSLVSLLCFVLFQALPVQAQEARLFLQQIPEEELSIGDTLRVEVYAVAHGLALTSASAYLSFDEQVFALVPASFAADGTVQPFVRGPFLPGQVYENSTAGDAEGGNGLTGFQLNYVAVSGTGENRSTGRDKAVLARVDLRVVGYPANGTSSVRLDAAGQRQPLYTTLQAPGVAHRFQTGPELAVEIAGEGLLSLDDRVMTFGERQGIDLEAHAITQKWSSKDITWQAWSADPERLAVEVDGRYLALIAIQDEGQVRVFYRVIWPDGQVDDGDFAVMLNAAVGRLAPVFLQVEEDAGTQHLDLGAFFIDKLAAVNGHWSLQDATGVQAKIDDEELLFAPVADWHGHQVLAVTWCYEAEQCETTTLEIEIAAVNDAPRIVVLAPQAVAVGGVRLGPALSEVASDPDHPLESLQFEVAGDGIVAVTIVDGIIALHGIAEGIGKVRLQVSDPLGAQAATEFEVQVVWLDAGPELAAMSDMVIEVGQSNQVAVGVTDADTPLAELQWSVAVEGPVAVEVIAGNLPLLELRGLAVGEAVVRLQVNDPEGSGAVVALRVRVEEPASDSKPGAEETAQEPVEEVDNSVPGETTTPADSAVAPAVDSAVAPAVDSAVAPAVDPAVAPAVDLVVDSAVAPAVDPVVAPAVDLAVDSAVDPAVVASDNVTLDTPVAPIDQETDPPALPAPSQADRAGTVLESVGALPETEQENPVAESDSNLLQLGDIPDLYLAQGEIGGFWLDEYVVIGTAANVQWSVTGMAGLRVEIDAQRRVEIQMPLDFSGREVLLFTADDDAGHSAVVAVRVWVLAVEEQEAEDEAVSSDVQEADAKEEEKVAPGPIATPLELVGWPEISLLVGRVDSTLLLDSLVVTGDPGAVIWSLRGGVFIRASIDRQRRLHLDGTDALPGREIFFLEALLGSTIRQVQLTVGVQAAVFALQPMEILRLESTERTLDLGAFVVGDFAPEEIEWSMQIPAGIDAELADGQLRVVAGQTGLFAFSLEAASPAGQTIAAELIVEVLAADEVDEGGELPGVVPVEPNAEEPLPTIGESIEEEIPVQVDAVENKPVDVRSPDLVLSGHLLATGTVEFHLRADEELAGMPVVIADGLVLAVAARDDYYVAQYTGASGSIQVLAAGSDLAGNTAETQLALSAGNGPGILSPDGLLRVQGRLGAVLLYGDEKGYRVDLQAGSTAELVFSGAAPGQGLFRLGEEGWQEIPAQIGEDALFAVVAEGGLYRLAKGSAAVVQAVPTAYPNPFNAEVVLRYHVAAEGRVRVVVYDALGAQIRVLLNQWQGAGLRTMLWDARDQGGAEAASGIYLLVVEVGGERRARKVMLIR